MARQNREDRILAILIWERVSTSIADHVEDTQN